MEQWIEKVAHGNEVYSSANGHGLLNFHTLYCEKAETFQIEYITYTRLHSLSLACTLHNISAVLQFLLATFLNGPKKINKWNDVTETRSFGMVLLRDIATPHMIRQHLILLLNESIIYHLYVCFSSLPFF